VRIKREPLKITVTKTYFITPEMTEGTLYLPKQLFTYYYNCKSQTDDTPNHTATGEFVYKGGVAPSGKYYGKELRAGDLILVEKTGEILTVNDRTKDRDEKDEYIKKLPEVHENHFDQFFYKEEIPGLKKHPLWKKGFFYSDVYAIKLKQGYPFKQLFKITGDKEESEEGVAIKFYKLIQKKLKAKKLYSGKVDGVIGSGTIKSIREFQKANKLTANGIVDSKTLKKLIQEEKK